MTGRLAGRALAIRSHWKPLEAVGSHWKPSKAVGSRRKPLEASRVGCSAARLVALAIECLRKQYFANWSQARAARTAANAMAMQIALQAALELESSSGIRWPCCYICTRRPLSNGVRRSTRLRRSQPNTSRLERRSTFKVSRERSCEAANATMALAMSVCASRRLSILSQTDANCCDQRLGFTGSELWP